MLNKAETFADKEKWDKAIKLLRKLHKMAPNNEEIILKLARVLSWANHNLESIDYYNRYLAKYPKNTKILKEKALVLTWEDRCDKAVPIFEKLRKKDIENSEIITYLAQCAYSNNYYREADKLISFLKKIDDITNDAAKIKHKLDKEKKTTISSDTEYNRDSEQFNDFKEQLSVGIYVADWFIASPHVSYERIWQNTKVLNVFGIGLNLSYPFIKYFTLEFDPGYQFLKEQNITNNNMMFESRLSFAYYSLFKATIKAGYGNGTSQLQTVSSGSVDAWNAGLELSATFIPRVTLSNDFSMFFFRGYKDKNFYLWNDDGEVALNLYDKYLQAGYRFYGTSFQTYFLNFWTPRYYLSHALFIKAVPYRWDESQFIEVEIYGGYAFENSFDGTSASSPLIGADAGITKEFSIIDFSLSGGFMQTIRESSGYRYYFVMLSLSMPL